MAVIRQDNVNGTLDASGMPSNSPTMSSAALANLPVVQGGDAAYIMLNPFGSNGVGPELVQVTAHTLNATTATVLRGVNPAFPAQNMPGGTVWVHGPTAEDFANFQTQINAFFTAAIMTGKGQFPIATGPGAVIAQAALAQWQVNRGDTAAATGQSASLGLTIPCTRATRPAGATRYPGMMIAESDTLHTLMFDGTTFQYTDDAPGTIKMSANGTLQAGYVWADGSTYDGANPVYADLFTAIGTNYGSGGGSLFKVPDYRECGPIGYDFGAGAPSPRRVTAATVIGVSGGAESVVVGVGNMPSHNHSASAGNTAPSFSGTTSTTGDHYHTYGADAVDTQQGTPFFHVPYQTFGTSATVGLVSHPPSGPNPANLAFTVMDSAGDHSHTVTGTVASHTHSVTVGNTGGGSALEVQNPYQTCAFMVRL